MFVDLGNGRLMRLGWDLEFGQAHSIARPQDDGVFAMVLLAGIEHDGNVYAAAVGATCPISQDVAQHTGTGGVLSRQYVTLFLLILSALSGVSR